jgi:hypothetical protein
LQYFDSDLFGLRLADDAGDRSGRPNNDLVLAVGSGRANKGRGIDSVEGAEVTSIVTTGDVNDINGEIVI